ncbi:MAG: hypothetical protein K5778_02145 [Bacteroidaceae bacterium]|nr:hypothetical protein [Bacteroidaceae bacterium]
MLFPVRHGRPTGRPYKKHPDAIADAWTPLSRRGRHFLRLFLLLRRHILQRDNDIHWLDLDTMTTDEAVQKILNLL